MTTKFPPRLSPPQSAEDFQLEEQQARLLAALRRADGAPVSYAELRDGGVEFPASVVSELELAGIEFDHCYVGEARGVVGVRLNPAVDQGSFSAPTELDGEPAEQQAATEPAHARARKRQPAMAALLVAREAALVWVGNAARRTRLKTRGIRTLPRDGRALLPRVSGAAVAARLNGGGLAERLNGRALAERLDARAAAERLKSRLSGRLNVGPLAHRLDGHSRGLLGLGAIVLAMAAFAAVGLTAGGGRPHRTAAHHRHPRVLSTASAPGTRRPAVHHPTPSQTSATGTIATTSTCSACQVVSTVRSARPAQHPPRRAKAPPPAPQHSRPAPRPRTAPAPSRPPAPIQHPTGGQHQVSTSTTAPGDQQHVSGGTGTGP